MFNKLISFAFQSKYELQFQEYLQARGSSKFLRTFDEIRGNELFKSDEVVVNGHYNHQYGLYVFGFNSNPETDHSGLRFMAGRFLSEQGFVAYQQYEWNFMLLKDSSEGNKTRRLDNGLYVSSFSGLHQRTFQSFYLPENYFNILFDFLNHPRR